MHLVLNFDYEVPSEPGSDGAGFDVDVDDWDDVNMDIAVSYTHLYDSFS